MRLRDKTIVVVGGSTGLGLAAARAFASEGARLVLVGRNLDSLREAQSSIPSEVQIVAGDAVDSATSARAVELAVEAFGRLDGLYHVAGGSGRRHGDGPLHEVSDEGVDFTLNLNFKSLLFSNRAAVRRFREQGGGGAILNMGSVLGWSPSPNFFATHVYAAAKAAIVGFSKSIAAYYAAEGIRVNVLAPALVETPMAQRAAQDAVIQSFIRTKQPLDGGRIGCPEDCNGAAVHLLSDEARFCTGQVLAVDGGWTVSEGQMEGSR